VSFDRGGTKTEQKSCWWRKLEQSHKKKREDASSQSVSLPGTINRILLGHVKLVVLKISSHYPQRCPIELELECFPHSFISLTCLCAIPKHTNITRLSGIVELRLLIRIFRRAARKKDEISAKIGI
jgi:hypothetical protein